MEQGSADLRLGDARTLPLDDSTVDLIVTSPPYFRLRSYRDGGKHFEGQIGSEPTTAEYLEALWAVTSECMRVLKPTGSMFVNLGDKYARSGGHNDAGIGGASRGPSSYTRGSDDARNKSLMCLPERYRIGCIDRLGLIVRAVIVWSKPNGMPESVTDRVRRSHDDWVHLTKAGTYFSGIDEIREAHQGKGVTAAERRARDPQGYQIPNRALKAGTQTIPSMAAHPLGKLPGSVWSIPTEPVSVTDDAKERLGLPNHFAAFPQEWPRRLILGWSPTGICVECGEARVPVVSKALQQTGSSTGRVKVSDLSEYENQRGWNGPDYPLGRTVATITGYACACPEPTARTRPAVVLDPFVGTGTTVMVARALGRHGVGMDLSYDYLNLASWRVFQSGHDLKTIERTYGKARADEIRKCRLDPSRWEPWGPPDEPEDTDGFWTTHPDLAELMGISTTAPRSLAGAVGS
jgi:DNA modification methylase